MITLEGGTPIADVNSQTPTTLVAVIIFGGGAMTVRHLFSGTLAEALRFRETHTKRIISLQADLPLPCGISTLFVAEDAGRLMVKDYGDVRPDFSLICHRPQ